MDLCLAVRVEGGQDIAVLFQDGVDATEVAVRFSMQAVVVGGAALVGTELLIRTAVKRLAAFQTIACFHDEGS